MRVALQECRESNANFVRSMAQPVDLGIYEALVSKEQYTDFLRYHASASARLWGLKPSQANLTAYEAMRRGDLVLFHEPPRRGSAHRDSRVFLVGRVGYKFRNLRLANALWGESRSEVAYEFIFSVEHARPLDSSLTALADGLGIPRAARLSGFQIRDVPEGALADMLPYLP